MPANFSLEFGKAQNKFQAARTTEEKLAALLEMKQHAPHHKGGENLRADISRKIKSLREQMEKKAEQKKKGSAPSLAVKKDGIGQIVLIGAPNSGKSTFLSALTHADIPIAPYPFTTTKPEVGMLDYQGANVQLVELPGVVPGSAEGRASGAEILSIARTADALVLVLTAESCWREYQSLKRELEKAIIRVNETRPKIAIEKSDFKGIQISGESFLRVPRADFEDYLKDRGYYNSNIILEEPIDIQKMEQALDPKWVYKRALGIVVEKFPGTLRDEQRIPLQKALFFYVVHDYSPEVQKMLGQSLFSLLNKVLVFTKKPRGDVAPLPLGLKIGATVQDLAEEVHKEFASTLKYAKVWGSTKYPGQRVAKDYVLQQGDVVELYA